MNKDLKYILLIDDDEDDNYFHEKAIKKNNPENIVIIKTSGILALEYLESVNNTGPRPDLIFLDINMPRMNGWEFLDAYNLLDKKQQSEAIIIMLTTSQNLQEKSQAKSWSFVFDYITKPLTPDIIQEIVKKYFSHYNGVKPLPILP